MEHTGDRGAKKPEHVHRPAWRHCKQIKLKLAAFLPSAVPTGEAPCAQVFDEFLGLEKPSKSDKSRMDHFRVLRRESTVEGPNPVAGGVCFGDPHSGTQQSMGCSSRGRVSLKLWVWSDWRRFRLSNWPRRSRIQTPSKKTEKRDWSAGCSAAHTAAKVEWTNIYCVPRRSQRGLAARQPLPSFPDGPDATFCPQPPNQLNMIKHEMDAPPPTAGYASKATRTQVCKVEFFFPFFLSF